MATLEVEGSSQGRARHQPSHQLLNAQPAAENTRTRGRLPQDHDQSQNEGSSEKAALNLSEASMLAHMTTQSFLLRGSTMQTATSGSPNAIQSQQPISLNTDPPVTEDRLSLSYLLRSKSSQAHSPRRSLSPAPGGSIAFCEARSSPSHREAEHSMHWDQDGVEPANQMSSEAGSRGHAPPAAISVRGLLTPAATLEMEVRDGSTINVSNSAPESLPIAIQPQHTVNLDANPAEDGGNDGYNSPASTLQMGGGIAQGGAMSASDVRDADPAEDYEDGNLCGDLVSSETVVAASSTNDDEDEDNDGDDDDDDGSEDGYGSLPMVSKYANRSARQQPGISKKRRRRRQRKDRCEEEARPNSPAHSVTEGQSPPTSSLGKDSSPTNVSDDPAPTRRKRDQPRSEEGEDERTAKRQKTHKQQATESAATEMVQDQGQSSTIQPRQSSCGRPICLDSPAITTPPAEPSSVHSPPSRSLNVSLDADSAKDGDDSRPPPGASIPSETAMVAPGPRGSDVGAHDDGDDVYGVHRQSDSPSQREEQGRQQQQDTLERQDIATEVTAKVDSAFGKMDERVKAAELRQREAEEEEENIKSRIESEEMWQHNLKESIKESVEEVRKLEKKLKDCRKEKESAAREAKDESQRKRDIAQEIEDVLRRHGGM
ncbi:hypothetical protein MRS44_003876 [Fusarium solani]|uniref:uncharacterized protein n=1 Tax=Fusarium solani TaxID=169388 RepID=UPI0032C43C13|nr:hypothetical protein MRS44_003876 [Fusarium solani]